MVITTNTLEAASRSRDLLHGLTVLVGESVGVDVEPFPHGGAFLDPLPDVTQPLTIRQTKKCTLGCLSYAV